MKVKILLFDGKGDKKQQVRLVPRLGPIREQSPTESPKVCPKPRPFSKRNLVMAFTLTATQEVTVTIDPRDKKGNKAKLDGTPEWPTDNSEILTVTPAADGLSCLVTATGMVGTANVQVTGDADLGTGTTPIIGTLEVEVTPGTATTVVITPGTPTETP